MPLFSLISAIFERSVLALVTPRDQPHGDGDGGDGGDDISALQDAPQEQQFAAKERPPLAGVSNLRMSIACAGAKLLGITSFRTSFCQMHLHW